MREKHIKTLKGWKGNRTDLYQRSKKRDSCKIALDFIGGKPRDPVYRG